MPCMRDRQGNKGESELRVEIPSLSLGILRASEFLNVIGFVVTMTGSNHFFFLLDRN